MVQLFCKYLSVLYLSSDKLFPLSIVFLCKFLLILSLEKDFNKMISFDIICSFSYMWLIFTPTCMPHFWMAAKNIPSVNYP